jgi:hypothetical protein
MLWLRRTPQLRLDLVFLVVMSTKYCRAVVAAAVGADVDVLHQEVVLVVAFLARVVHRVLLRVVVDTVEVLDRVVVVVVVTAVDGLIGEVASRSQQRLSGVGPERDLVLMGERSKVRVSLAVAGVSQRSFQRLEVEDHRRVSYQFVQLKLQVHLLVAVLQLSFLHVHARVEVVHVDKILGRRWVRCQLGQLVRRLEQYEGLGLGPRWVLESGTGIQSFEEGIPLLRRQLSYHWQHLFRQGKLHLELGDQLVLGLVLGLDLVGVVVADGLAHRRTARVAPRQRGGVVAVVLTDGLDRLPGNGTWQ